MEVPRYRCRQHTYDRMAERGVTHEHLEAALAAPESAQPDPSQKSVRLEARVGGRLLRVWIAAPWPPKWGQVVVIKSAAWKD